MKDNYIDNGECWYKLAAAIIIQAAKDYRRAQIIRKKLRADVVKICERTMPKYALGDDFDEHILKKAAYNSEFLALWRTQEEKDLLRRYVSTLHKIQYLMRWFESEDFVMLSNGAVDGKKCIRALNTNNANFDIADMY